MPAPIVHYLFAKRVQEELCKKGVLVPSEAAFLWGAQGTALLTNLRNSGLTAAALQLSGQPPAVWDSLLHDCCGMVQRENGLSCAEGLLCSSALEQAATPYISWCAAQMAARDRSQPAEIWKNEEESALDCILLRYECGALPTDFSLLQALPKSGTVQSDLAELFAYLLEKGVGLPYAQELCLQALEESRRLYRRLTDSTGLKRIFYLRREHDKPHTWSSRMRSFTEDASFDYANLSGAAWGTGENPDSRTFLQLYDETAARAVQRVTAWKQEQDARITRTQSHCKEKGEHQI